MQLYRISGASSFTVKYRPDEEDPLPLPFDIIRQLAAMVSFYSPLQRIFLGETSPLRDQEDLKP